MTRSRALRSSLTSTESGGDDPGTGGNDSETGGDGSGTGDNGETAEDDDFAPVEEAAAIAEITGRKSDSDLRGSKFSVLKLRASKVTKTSVKLKWASVKGAVRYVVLGNKCGKNNKAKVLKSTTAKSYTAKKLKKGKYYKYVVLAVDKNSLVIAKSKYVHAATSGGKVGNPKKVKIKNVKKSKVTLKKGKAFKLKTVIIKGKGKIRKHRAIKYESSNNKVATVTSKGKIKAVRKGTCYVYAYAQNGVYSRVKVTVK